MKNYEIFVIFHIIQNLNPSTPLYKVPVSKTFACHRQFQDVMTGSQVLGIPRVVFPFIFAAFLSQ